VRARDGEISTSGVARARTLEIRTLTTQIGGIVLEEVLDLSFDRLLMTMMMMMMIYRENRNPNGWRNAVITPIFKKGDRREPQKLHRYYKILPVEH